MAAFLFFPFFPSPPRTADRPLGEEVRSLYQRLTFLQDRCAEQPLQTSFNFFLQSSGLSACGGRRKEKLRRNYRHVADKPMIEGLSGKSLFFFAPAVFPELIPNHLCCCWRGNWQEIKKDKAPITKAANDWWIIRIAGARRDFSRINPQS